MSQKTKFILELTQEQAEVLTDACDFYARMKLGQFREVVWRFLDFNLPVDEFCRRRDTAEEILLEARKHIYPELHGEGHSYGIGHDADADISFGIHQVMRQALGKDDRPPFSLHSLPVCRKEETDG